MRFYGDFITSFDQLTTPLAPQVLLRNTSIYQTLTSSNGHTRKKDFYLAIFMNFGRL